MTRGPLVSVVIPCRNQGEYLRSALRSIAAQSYTRIETIVVDDGSTDDTPRVALEHGARLLQQAHRGLGAARNAGLGAAAGEYVVFLDADDELFPDAIELGVETLECDPNACMVAGRSVLIDREGRQLPTSGSEPLSDDLYGEWLVRNFVWTPGAAMFRREPLIAVGGFARDVGPASDYAVYLELARYRC